MTLTYFSRTHAPLNLEIVFLKSAIFQKLFKLLKKTLVYIVIKHVSKGTTYNFKSRSRLKLAIAKIAPSNWRAELAKLEVVKTSR